MKKTYQQGAVLLLCLVLLAVVTLLGLSTMRSSSLGMKMVTAMNDKALAFESAEQTLVRAEQWIEQTGFNPASSFYHNCSGALCFNQDCNGGLCAFYNPADPFASAQIGYECNAKLQPLALPAWQWQAAEGEQMANLWRDASKHKTVAPVHPQVTQAAKYIVEFMCYGDKPSSGQLCKGATVPADVNERCAPQFRITALASGRNVNSQVMLQSFYKKLN